MTQNEVSAGISRRTVTKAMAWAVPTIAVASTVPLAAASHHEPPPPTFNWDLGFKNPGNSCKDYSCVAKQSYTTPVSVSNPSDDDFIIVFTDYVVGGQSDGVNTVFSGDCVSVVSDCGSSCSLPAGSKSVCVPAHTASMTFNVSSGNHGSSPNGSQAVPWQWVRASDCVVTAQDTATSPTAPPGECVQ